MMTGKLFLNNIENPVNQTVTCTGEGGLDQSLQNSNILKFTF